MRLGDRIAVMRDGEIVQLGTAEDILVTPANDYVASFTQDVDRSRVLTAGAIMAEAHTVMGTKAADGKELRTPQDVLAAAPATVPESTPIIDLFTPCSQRLEPGRRDRRQGQARRRRPQLPAARRPRRADDPGRGPRDTESAAADGVKKVASV